MQEVFLKAPPGHDLSDVLALCSLVSLHSTADVVVVYMSEYINPPPVLHPVTGEVITRGVNQGQQLLLRFPDRAAAVLEQLLSSIGPPYTAGGQRPDIMPRIAGEALDRVPA